MQKTTHKTSKTYKLVPADIINCSNKLENIVCDTKTGDVASNTNLLPLANIKTSPSDTASTTRNKLHQFDGFIQTNADALFLADTIFPEHFVKTFLVST
jgi:hypothetical protein